MSDKLKGVWIEGRLWENKDFLLVEKHLLQKIHDLDNEHGCTAMNAWFAEFLGISKSRVSQIISKFKRDKLVSVKLKYEGKQVVGRVINVLKGGVLLIKGAVLSVNRPLSQAKYPPLAGCEESNIILLNNTISNLRESKKALTQENEDLILKVQKLEAENLELKNKSEAQKGKEKSSAKKEKGKHEFLNLKPKKSYKANTNSFPSIEEFDEMPVHQDQIKKKYELELSKFTYPETWTEYLISQFLEWCAGQEENLKGKFGATHVKALIRKINGHLKKYDAKIIGDSIELALVNPKWSTFEPKYIIDRENKEKQDEANRREQTDSNGKPLQSKYERFNEDFFGSQHTSDAAPEDSNVQEF